MRFRAAGALFSVAVAGCAGTPAKPVYLNRNVVTVAVLPPFMETTDPEAWKELWPYVCEAVAHRGYRVVPAATIEAFYEKNRFQADPAEIKLYKTEELAKEFGADAVMYTTITRWGFRYLVLYSDYGVEADFELHDGKTDEVVWRGQAGATESGGMSRGGRGGILEGVLSAAGNAFLSDKDKLCRRCAHRGMSRLPLPGFDPAPLPENVGTKEESSQSKEDQTPEGIPK